MGGISHIAALLVVVTLLLPWSRTLPRLLRPGCGASHRAEMAKWKESSTSHFRQRAVGTASATPTVDPGGGSPPRHRRGRERPGWLFCRYYVQVCHRQLPTHLSKGRCA